MKDLLRPAAALSGLWALAVAQPLLDALRRAPEFFVAYRADTVDAFIVAGVLTFGVPVVLVALLATARAAVRSSVTPATALFIGVLTALFALQIGYRAGVHGWIGAAAVAVLTAAAAAAAWLRVPAMRAFLAILSPAALVVPGVFLLGVTGGSSAAAAAQPGAAGSVRATPVVIMVFDELSLVSLLDDAGAINAARFPNMAALARDGVWYRNATAVSDYTRWALPAIVTGRYPAARSTPTPKDHPNTVFSLVGGSHRLEVSEAVTSLCPRQLCREAETPRLDRDAAMAADIVVVAKHVFLPPDARAGLPDLTQNWAGFAAAADDPDSGDPDEPQADAGRPGPRIIRATRDWQQRWHGARGTDHVESALAFIDGISRDDLQPTLYFIHTLASHRPSRWLPSGQRIPSLREIPGLVDGRWTTSEWLVAQHHHAEIMQAGLADTLVGRARDRLADAGLYSDALVIVTADHGVAMRPGDRARSFSGANAAEILSVPLIVKFPAAIAGVAHGTIDDSNAETIDVLPTVARVLGINPPWPVDGRALIGDSTPRPRKTFYFNAGTMTETFGPGELQTPRDAAARRAATLFGLDKWPAFNVPGYLGLIGRDVSSFGAIRSLDDVRVAVENRDALKQVDPQAADLPAQLVGRISASDSAAAGRDVIAVALNGRIVATTRAWPGGPRWMAMLPPDRLQAGSNEIEVFVVDGAKQDALLRPRQ